MRWGISGAPVPDSLPYAAAVNAAAAETNFPPLFLYAIAYRESIREYGDTAAGRMSDNGDGGYGLCQLTEPWDPGIQWPPADWDDPHTNAVLAVVHYLQPAVDYWAGHGFLGEPLLKLAAATFNEGLGNAIAAHNAGNVDKFDTDDYGAGVLAIYETLVTYGKPVQA
jgi:hypothetical protein